MALFPDSFVADLKAQTDIVSVIGDVTPLRKAGTSFKGLCPFHTEKTPSFNVNADRGFFKCFGCGASGDVVKFVQLHDKLSFPEAVRVLAQRANMPVPEADGSPDDRLAASEREALVKLHEDAKAFYIEQLAGRMAARARQDLERRGIATATIEKFEYGYAPSGGALSLTALFAARNVPPVMQLKSGLVMEREAGRLSDRFRNRLMIPIARDSGATVAFGGRSLEEGQVPKYLNSPETPIYTKGRTLYGLHVTKGAVREHNYSVLVEGYFDFAQVWQAGVHPVVASCGTALTSAQARILKRFAAKVVLSFDPDAAGREAAARSSELLVLEGFQVNVALLPAGSDPDSFIQQSGGQAYVERLKGSQPYLDYLQDRAAAGLDLNRQDHRKQYLDAMLTVAAIIPDVAARDQFADRLAHKARITESVVRDEIRKAAAQRKTAAPAIAVNPLARLRPAEQGLLWTVAHRPVEGLAAIGQLEPGDLDGLLAGPVFEEAASLSDMPPEVLPELLRERLSTAERALFELAASADGPAAAPSDCLNAIRRLRLERERALVQDEIDQLQRDAGMTDQALATLWERKMALSRRLEALHGA